MDETSRRDVLKLGSTGLFTALAGCSDLGSTSETGTTDGSSTTGPGSPETGTPTPSGPTRAELERRVGELEARLETLRSRLESKDERILSLQTDVADRRDRIETLERDLESLNEQLENETARVETLESTLAEKDKRISELEDEVEPSSRSSAFSEDVRESALSVGEGVRDAVVVLRGSGGASGTGWFHEDGHVITNSHVVDGQDSVTAWTLGGESFEPTVLGASDYMNSPYDDVAVLETDLSPPDSLSVGDSDTLESDQPVVQVGHPAFVGNWVLSLGKFVERGFGDSVLTTVPNRSGNSGSPLVTLSGDVVGLTTGSVARDNSGGGGTPEPVDLEVHEEYPESTYATHEPTSIVEKYIEDFG